MSELSNLIFKNKKHKLSSPFGSRAVINTSAGSTSSFHNGADYSTYNEKLKQYAVTDGKIISCGIDTAYGSAKYVWVEYPKLKVKMLHYHLDEICVKKGQTVNSGTVIGLTGKTGMATGIHLHLGIKRLSGSNYIDPEKWSKEEFPALLKNIEKSKEKPETKPKYKTGNYKVKTAAVLHVRTGAGTKYQIKSFSQLTSDAQKKIKTLNNGKPANGYVKGVTFTASQIKEANGYTWGKTPSGWVALDYCEAI